MAEEKYNVTSEQFPPILDEFIKNNPNMKHESLYLCESVDMDGNVIDTKVGVNLLTNYGLSDHFASGNRRDSEWYIWLGSGQTEPDPASSTLTSYISNLGKGSGYTYWDSSSYPPSYDRDTKLWSVRKQISQMYWDYTAGSNGEYEIWEIGVGQTRTTLRTHALIYDEEGNQTCIVKRPNTRLYITSFWTGSIDMSDIPKLYNEGVYILMDPTIAVPDYGYKTMYWCPMARGVMYTKNNKVASDYAEMNEFRWNTHSDTNVVTGDPREVHYESGPSSSNTKFWEDNYWYLSGWYVGTTSWVNRYQSEATAAGSFAMMFREQQETPEELETYWAYTNDSFTSIGKSPSTYTGNECDNWQLLRLDSLFGVGHQNYIDGPYPINWSYPRGMLPCVNFDITELNLYNYITKQWDVQIPYKNEPDQIYDYNWYYLYKKLFVNYKGTSQNVYVFVNMFPHDSDGKPISRITSFDNTNMTIAATDEYWDISTYEEIPNLKSVPSELQQKRYYVIVAGTVAALSPQTSREDFHVHELRPTRPPFELTHDTTGIIPRIPNFDSEGNFSYRPHINDKYFGEDYNGYYTVGSMPLVSNEKGFFCINWMLIFADSEWNIKQYDLLIDDKYPGCKFRRYMTRNGDKLLWFSTRTCSTIVDGKVGSGVTRSYAIAANNLSIWTITDSDTMPTREDLVLTWSDTSVVNDNTAWHLYSWSDLGYLVVAKRRTETEFIWVDVYGENGAEMHLVTDAKHARAIERTTLCAYQDTNLSMDTTYVFQIYDMSEQKIVDTVTIDDGVMYTIHGLYGYNDHLYVRVTSSDSVDYTYYYNFETKSLERLTFAYSFMYSTYPYWCCKTTATEKCMILTYSNGSNAETYFFDGTDSHALFGDNVDIRAKSGKCFPCVNTVNDGKQFLLTLSGRYDTNYTSNVLDLGLILDSPNRQVTNVPYDYYGTKEIYYTDWDISGPLIPYNNGIIKVVSSSFSYFSDGKSGRIWWFPLEMCMPMHMKGTTLTLNSYNQPVRWSMTKKLKWDITNDLSRLLTSEDDNGG